MLSDAINRNVARLPISCAKFAEDYHTPCTINKDLCKFPFPQGRSLSSYHIHSDRWLTWSGKNIEELGYTFQHRPSFRVDLVLIRQEVIHTVDSLPHSIDRVVSNEDYKYLMANLADAFSDCLYVNFRIPMVVPILK